MSLISLTNLGHAYKYFGTITMNYWGDLRNSDLVTKKLITPLFRTLIMCTLYKEVYILYNLIFYKISLNLPVSSPVIEF